MTPESQRTHHYGIWMTTTVVVLLAALYISALVLLSRIQGAVSMQTTELAAEARREESMHTTSDLLKDLSGETMKVDAFFTPIDGAVGVIEGVEALSSSVGVPVTVSDAHIQDQDPTTGEGTFSITVSAQGPWHSVVHVLALLDALPYQSELSSATLTLDDDGDDAPQWSFRGLLKVPLRQ